MFEKGRQILYKAYWEDVESIANSLLEQLDDGEIKDRDDLDQAIDGAADSWWTTYTGPSIAVLLVSNNDKAIFDFVGEVDDSGTGIYHKMSVAAMREDIVQRLLKEPPAMSDLDEMIEYYERRR